MIVVVVSGCSDALFGDPSSPQSEDERGSNVEKELNFEHEPSSPIAVDSEVRYTVVAEPGFGWFESLTIEPDSDAVEVLSKSLEPSTEPSFSLRASQTGTHSIQLRAQFEEEGDLERTFEMDVREIADVQFDARGHEPRELDADQPAPYLVDSQARILYTPVGPEGERLSGFGDPPVDWEPKDALSVVEPRTGGGRIVFETRSDPGVVTLKSKPGSATRDIELITPEMVEDLALAERARGFVESGTALPLEGLWAAHIVPVYDGVTIIDSSLEVTLTSKTHDVCAVLSDDRSTFEEETGREVESAIPDKWPGDGFVIDIRGAGECRLRAEFPEANGGSGAELQESFQIAE